MQSQTKKRAVSRVTAVFGALVAITLVQAPAAASPAHAPQQPSGDSSDALEEYRELAGEAEELNEQYLRAQEDLEEREDDLDSANDELAEAEQDQQSAIADVDDYRVDVDEFADASFTSSGHMSKMSALLTVDSAQEFLDRSSALDLLANDQNEALSRLQSAVDETESAEQQAEEARASAEEAKTEAEELANDIESRKDELDDQLDELAEQSDLLGASDQAAQEDPGLDIGDVEAPGPAAQNAIDAALGKRGSPYVWGAQGPDEFDCSGLTQWAYSQAGIDIPRSSSSQSTHGTPVSRDELEAGDMVFFYSPVSHVGIYLGDGNIVHAPTTGDVVKVSPLDEQSQYSGARRVA